MWKHQFQKSQIASFIARSTSFENRNGLQSWPVNVLLARWSVWSTPGILFVPAGENVHVLVCYGSVTSDPCPQGSHSSMTARKSLKHVRKEVTQACPQGSHSISAVGRIHHEPLPFPVTLKITLRVFTPPSIRTQPSITPRAGCVVM